MRRSIVPVAVLVLAATQTALAAETKNVQSLMDEGYTVVGVISSQAGPGVFLQKGNSLAFCCVAETPGSAAVDTRYCKPVK